MAGFPATVAALGNVSMSVVGGQVPITTVDGNILVYETGRPKWTANIEINVRPGADLKAGKIAIEDWIAQFYQLRSKNTINMTSTGVLDKIPVGKVFRPITKALVSGATRYTCKSTASSRTDNLEFYYPINGQYFNVVIGGKRRLFRVIDAVGAQFSVFPETNDIPATDSGSSDIVSADAIFECRLEGGAFDFLYDTQFTGPWQLSVIED